MSQCRIRRIFVTPGSYPSVEPDGGEGGEEAPDLRSAVGRGGAGTTRAVELWENQAIVTETQASPEGKGAQPFHALLEWLDPDPERAGRAYENLRTRLLRLYEWRGADLADELVDETLDRVARRLAEGEEVRTTEPIRYVYGVARRVFHELVRREQRRRRALEKDPWPLPPPSTEAEKTELESRLKCLREGLEGLTAKARTMILTYYQGDKGEKIANRKRLAKELKIPINALRIRAYRVRSRLEAAVRECLDSTEK